MIYKAIKYRVDDRVARVTLNRPERMNALSLQLCREVNHAVEAADRNDGVRVIVINGSGGKAFSAGYDLNELEAPGGNASGSGKRPGVAAWRKRLDDGVQYNFTLWNCSKPVIAMIDGYCLAGGLEFVQMCDIRYASDVSKFGVVSTRFANGVATLAMPWIIGPACRELIYSGDTIDAAEALRIGLVNKVFPKSALERETMKLAKRISRVALACLQWNKRAINNTYHTMGFRSAMQYGVEACCLLDTTETPEFKAFEAIRRKSGVQAAIKWRHKQFKPFE